MMRYLFLAVLFVLAGCDSTEAEPDVQARFAVGTEHVVRYLAAGEGDCVINWSEPDGTGHERAAATLDEAYGFTMAASPVFLNLRARCVPPSSMALTLVLDGEAAYEDGWTEADAERGRFGIGGGMVLTSHP